MPPLTFNQGISDLQSDTLGLSYRDSCSLIEKSTKVIQEAFILRISREDNNTVNFSSAQLRTRFPVVRSTWNLYHIKSVQLAPQNPQIKQIAQSRSCGRSSGNHENWVLGYMMASTVLYWTMIWWKWLAETVKKVAEDVYPNFHQIPSTQFPCRFIQKTAFSPYWSRSCCSSGIWNTIEILVWMHLLCSTTPT